MTSCQLLQLLLVTVAALLGSTYLIGSLAHLPEASVAGALTLVSVVATALVHQLCPNAHPAQASATPGPATGTQPGA